MVPFGSSLRFWPALLVTLMRSGTGLKSTPKWVPFRLDAAPAKLPARSATAVLSPVMSILYIALLLAMP